MGPNASDIKALLHKIGYSTDLNDDWTDISSIGSKMSILQVLMDTSLQCLGAVRLICVDIEQRHYSSDDSEGSADDEYATYEVDDDSEYKNHDSSEEYVTMQSMLSSFEFAMHSMAHAISSLDTLEEDQEKYKERRKERQSIFVDQYHKFEMFATSQAALTPSSTSISNHSPNNTTYTTRGLSIFEGVAHLYLVRRILNEYPSASRIEDRSKNGHDWLCLNWFSIATNYFDGRMRTLLATHAKSASANSLAESLNSFYDPAFIEQRQVALDHLIRVNPLMLVREDSDGVSPIHFASRVPCMDPDLILTMLAAYNKYQSIYPDTPPYIVSFPLHAILERTLQPSLVDNLAERFSGAAYSPDDEGNNCIHVAALQNTSSEVLRCLLKRLETPPRQLLICNNDGRTPLHLAAAGHALETVVAYSRYSYSSILAILRAAASYTQSLPGSTAYLPTQLLQAELLNDTPLPHNAGASGAVGTPRPAGPYYSTGQLNSPQAHTALAVSASMALTDWSVAGSPNISMKVHDRHAGLPGRRAKKRNERMSVYDEFAGFYSTAFSSSFELTESDQRDADGDDDDNDEHHNFRDVAGEAGEEDDNEGDGHTARNVLTSTPSRSNPMLRHRAAEEVGLLGLTGVPSDLSKEDRGLRSLLVDQRGEMDLIISRAIRGSLECVQALGSVAPEAYSIVDKYGCLPLHLAAFNNGCVEVVSHILHQYPAALKVATVAKHEDFSADYKRARKLDKERRKQAEASKSHQVSSNSTGQPTATGQDSLQSKHGSELDQLRRVVNWDLVGEDSALSSVTHTVAASVSAVATVGAWGFSGLWTSSSSSTSNARLAPSAPITAVGDRQNSSSSSSRLSSNNNSNKSAMKKSIMRKGALDATLLETTKFKNNGSAVLILQQERRAAVGMCDGCLPLHLAAKNCHLSPRGAVARLLLHSYPLGARLQDKRGQTPLHYLVDSRRHFRLQSAHSGFYGNHRLDFHARIGFMRELVKSFPLAVAVPNQDLNSPYDLVCLNWAKANKKKKQRLQMLGYKFLEDSAPSPLQFPLSPPSRAKSSPSQAPANASTSSSSSSSSSPYASISARALRERDWWVRRLKAHYRGADGDEEDEEGEEGEEDDKRSAAGSTYTADTAGEFEELIVPDYPIRFDDLFAGVESEFELLARLLLEADSTDQDPATLRALRWKARRAAAMLTHHVRKGHGCTEAAALAVFEYRKRSRGVQCEEPRWWVPLLVVQPTPATTQRTPAHFPTVDDAAPSTTPLTNGLTGGGKGVVERRVSSERSRIQDTGEVIRVGLDSDGVPSVNRKLSLVASLTSKFSHGGGKGGGGGGNERNTGREGGGGGGGDDVGGDKIRISASPNRVAAVVSAFEGRSSSTPANAVTATNSIALTPPRGGRGGGGGLVSGTAGTGALATAGVSARKSMLLQPRAGVKTETRDEARAGTRAGSTSYSAGRQLQLLAAVAKGDGVMSPGLVLFPLGAYTGTIYALIAVSHRRPDCQHLWAKVVSYL